MDKFDSIEDYINSCPKEVRGVLQDLRKTITEEIPNSEETMSYKMPAFKSNGQYIIYFAAWKNHISLYPFTGEMEKSIPESKDYKTSGKGTIQFPLDQPLPIKLVQKIVQHRLKEALQKS